MKKLLPFLFFLAVSPVCQAQDDTAAFRTLVDEAAASTNLIAPGSQPFHLKLEAADSTKAHPEYQTEFEIWWAAPDKWRRELKSPMFSETAVQNGAAYSESTSGDYLPRWLYELMTVPLNPVPVEELAVAHPEFSGTPDGRCAKWETPYSGGGDTISIYESVCFQYEVPREVFVGTVATKLSAYQAFGAKNIARAMELYDRITTIRGYIVTLEPLAAESDARFVVAHDTGLNARNRFVAVPEADLEQYKLDIPPMVWPAVHNFPNSGVIVVRVTLDRTGAVREIDSPISRNVVLSNPAMDQIRNWKFKPYLVDGSPVQVSTHLAVPFKAKFELLGTNPAGLEAVPFIDRIKRSRELSDLNIQGCQPFHLLASFQWAETPSGTYDLVWQEPTKWRRETKLGDVSVLESQSGDRVYRKVLGAAFSPTQIDDVIQELDGHLPDKRYAIYEGDWGQSAVKFNGSDVVRVARGKVDEQNNPVSGQAYWFASGGLLLGAFEESQGQPGLSHFRMSTYLNFADWNGKQVPRLIEVSEKGSVVLRLDITQIEALAPQSDSAFVLEGVQPSAPGRAAQLAASEIVPPRPLRKVAPKNPHAGHGTVIVFVQIDIRGYVTNVIVQQSGGQALDQAAVEAAKQWEFTPSTNKGIAVPGVSAIHFEF